jgi:cation diffusion facilitator family transporter
MHRSYTEAAAAVGTQTTLVGVIVNISLSAVKALAGIIGHSYALVADAVESATDVATSLIVLSGVRIAAKPADENHPYGHGKAEPLAALAVSAALCTAALGIAIQSVRAILEPHLPPKPFTLIVLAVVILVKETLFRFVKRRGKRVGSVAVQADAWHHRSDAITSSAAFVGISLAVVGGPRFASADAWAALVAAVLIGFNGVRLVLPALREIMDEVPETGIEGRVREAAQTVDGVRSLDRCTVRKMGLTYYVDLDVVVEGDVSVRDGHRIAHRVRDAVCAAIPSVSDVLVHVEPEGEEHDHERIVQPRRVQ